MRLACKEPIPGITSALFFPLFTLLVVCPPTSVTTMRTEPASIGNLSRVRSAPTQTIPASKTSTLEIAPELKVWLDLLVPMLVRQYLSEIVLSDNNESSIPVNGSERVQ